MTGTTDELLPAAQSGNAEAAAALFARVATDAHRIAAALTGSWRSADKVLPRLAQQGAGNLPRWRTDDEAERWFMHHTVLLSRQASAKSAGESDVLLEGVGGPDVVQYVAVVEAIRKLPFQQREAVLLTRARRWNPRLCAVAMDCSTTAVDTHLAEGERQLRPLAGTAYEPLMQYLHRVFQSLDRPSPVSPTDFARYVRRRRSGGRVFRAMAWGLIVVILLAILVFIFVALPRIEI